MAKLYHALCWVLHCLLIQKERESVHSWQSYYYCKHFKVWRERENNTPTWIIIIISWVQSSRLGWLEDLSLFTATAGASDLDCRTEESLWCESTQAFLKLHNNNNYNNKNNYSNNNDAGERGPLQSTVKWSWSTRRTCRWDFWIFKPDYRLEKQQRYNNNLTVLQKLSYMWVNLSAFTSVSQTIF